MKGGMQQSARLGQEMRANPRLYQAMDMLYMPLLDLQQHIKQELLNNPFLELEEPATPEEETVKEKAAEEEKEKEEQIDWEEILLDGFEAGSDECPDRSTTLIVQVADLAGGGAMTLAGPGILGSQRFAPRGLPKDFAARWAANNGLFPRGVDVILCAPAELAALPRTTRMTTGPAS